MITIYRVFLVLLGTIAGLMMPEARRLPADSQYTIGPGFLPTIMLSLIIVCCVALLILDFIKKFDCKIEKSSGIRLILYAIATILLVFGMEYAGIIFSVAVYIFLVTFFIEKNKCFTSIKVAVITSAFIYLIFHVWLKVPMTVFIPLGI